MLWPDLSNIPTPDWSLTYPQLIVFGLALVLMALDAFLPRPLHFGVLTGVSLIGYALAAAALWTQDGKNQATFWWSLPRNRQVRVTGSIERTDAATSGRYFADRPRAAQLASAASPQSRVVGSREDLERMVADLERRVGAGSVPRPEHWGGFLLVPATIEFWQGRTARLHDRMRYRRADDGWRIERLAP